MARKVLIFGATGEIGGRIAHGCLKAGHEVIGVTRGKNQRELSVATKGIKFITGDKSDENFLRGTVAKLDFDAVIDSVPTREGLELYHRHLKQARNVLICSSTGTFVPLQNFPADETHPWREETATNFHVQSVRDAYGLELWEKEKFPITILRPINIIGRDRIPLELWGGRDIEFFRKLKRHEPISIPPCENILLQSGCNDDLADAFVKALDHPDEIRGDIFIISCKKAITLGRYLRVAMDRLKSRSEIKVVSAEELMRLYPRITMRFGLEFLLEHMCFDIGKAERMIGYAPACSAEQGLLDALDWCESAGLL